jgi:hypothetical protein
VLCVILFNFNPDQTQTYFIWLTNLPPGVLPALPAPQKLVHKFRKRWKPFASIPSTDDELNERGLKVKQIYINSRRKTRRKYNLELHLD